MLYVKIVEAADVVMLVLERNWKENEYEYVFQNSLEKATKVQLQVSKLGIDDSTAAVATADSSFELFRFLIFL